jgi:hypothetical protein
MATSIGASRLREGIHAPSNSDFCRPPIPPHGRTVTINFRDVERGIRPAVESSAVTPAGARNPKAIQMKVVTPHIPPSTGQARRHGSAQHLANQPQHLYVRVPDGLGKIRAIRSRMLIDFPFPYARHHVATQSHTQDRASPTVVDTVPNPGTDAVNLRDMASVLCEFGTKVPDPVEGSDIESSY